MKTELDTKIVGPCQHVFVGNRNKGTIECEKCGEVLSRMNAGTRVVKRSFFTKKK